MTDQATKQEWGFVVSRYEKEYDWKNPDGSIRDDPIVRPVDPPRWKVSLPHQCGQWAIVEDWQPPDADPQDWDSWMTGTPQAAAVETLERFIAEAQEALAALRAGQEYGKEAP
jgi:hypothetical protein